MTGAALAPGESGSGLVLTITHETRCDYESPVAQAHHVACLQPLQDAWQRLEAFDLDIEPTPAPPRADTDGFGNVHHAFEVAEPHPCLVVRARSRVQVRDRFEGLRPAESPPWEAVREGLRYRVGGRFDPAVEFVPPSPYVPRLTALRDWAAPSFVPGRPLVEVALDLMHRLHQAFDYRPRSTSVDTPLATAFAQRAGVCQDFAHLFIGAWRMHGLPARYVSGYLRTEPPPGEAPLIGADASHAWVQIACPGTPGVPDDGWLDLDPTNDLVPARAHVRVAVGRDFGDVTPLRGVIHGGGRHTLTVGVTTREVAVPGDDPGRPFLPAR